MRKTVRALMLVLAMSTCAYAGDMGNGVATPPPPPQQTQTTSEPATSANDSTSADGDMGNGVMATATEATLSLIQTLLALF
jgi:hypothetical protein